MAKHRGAGAAKKSARRAFTLIELLVADRLRHS